MGRIDERVAKLERIVPLGDRGCGTCRFWGRSGVFDDFGYLSPPPDCPDCGRETPDVHHWVHIVGIKLGVDRDEQRGL